MKWSVFVTIAHLHLFRPSYTILLILPRYSCYRSLKFLIHWPFRGNFNLLKVKIWLSLSTPPPWKTYAWGSSTSGPTCSCQQLSEACFHMLSTRRAQKHCTGWWPSWSHLQLWVYCCVTQLLKGGKQLSRVGIPPPTQDPKGSDDHPWLGHRSPGL